jgi:hypothetical protein
MSIGGLGVLFRRSRYIFYAAPKIQLDTTASTTCELSMTARPNAMEFYKRPDTHVGICPVCNLLYVRELEEDRRLHRAFHHRGVDVFEPKVCRPRNKLLHLLEALVCQDWPSGGPRSDPGDRYSVLVRLSWLTR